jgi:hypothetical protein
MAMASPKMLYTNERTSSTFEEIPVMYLSYRSLSMLYHLTRLHYSSDLMDADSRDPSVRRALADQIRDACVNVGFFYSQTLHSRVLNWCIDNKPTNTPVSINSQEPRNRAVSNKCNRGQRERLLPVTARKENGGTITLPLGASRLLMKSQMDIHNTPNFKG